MEIYVLYLSLLILTIFLLFFYQKLTKVPSNPSSAAEKATLPPTPKDLQSARNFKNIYFGVYGLAIGADWLQGPYIFTHYNTTLSLPIPTISLLFTTSFLSAALSSLFTGRVADRYGRSRACIVFCILYFLSCLSILFPYFPILFIGRVLGGISTTLLFSVFEAWMIAEFKTKGLERIVKVEEVFRDVAMLGSVTAIAAGLVGEMVKGYFGTTSAPFVLAAACLVAAGVGIYVFWDEHYGKPLSPSDEKPRTWITLRSKLSALTSNPRILTLAAATTLFEGTIYIFVFFWTSSLTIAHNRSLDPSSPTSSPPLPLGLIFSAFMCATLLGSLSLPLLTHLIPSPRRLLVLIFLLSALSIIAPVFTTTEAGIFWAFMLFEACIGVYFPTMSRLKGEVVDEEMRATVYGLMRLPLNGYVVLILGALSAGGSDVHSQNVGRVAGRDWAFLVCGVLLVGVVPVIRKWL